MNGNLLLAEQIIRCVQKGIKNMTVFCNPCDQVKVKEIVNEVNRFLFKNQKDLFLTLIISDLITEGELITSVEAEL